MNRISLRRPVFCLRKTGRRDVPVATRKDMNADEVLARADMALYDSKRAGKNTVLLR